MTPGVRYVMGTIPGLKRYGKQPIAVLNGDSHISRWVEEAGRLDHDQNALPVIGRYINRESVVYDVGAFIGDHTAYYASLAKRVLAFEPMDDAFYCLEQNTRRFGNVMCFNYAIGGREYYSGYNPEEPNKGARRLAPMLFGKRRSVELSTWEPPPTFVKLDIEGWEVRALEGSRAWFQKHHPIIVCEVNAEALGWAMCSPNGLHRTLEACGYKDMVDLYTEKPWVPNDPRPQFDIVCR